MGKLHPASPAGEVPVSRGPGWPQTEAPQHSVVTALVIPLLGRGSSRLQRRDCEPTAAGAGSRGHPRGPAAGFPECHLGARLISKVFILSSRDSDIVRIFDYILAVGFSSN